MDHPTGCISLALTLNHLQTIMILSSNSPVSNKVACLHHSSAESYLNTQHKHPDQWLADEIDFMNAVCTEMEMECVDHMSVTDSSRKKNIRKECQQNHWDTAHCCLPGESLSKHLSQFQNTLINAKGSTLKDQ